MTTASAERSFSVLKRIETYLSTTISDERLTHLAMLSMHALESRDEPKILIWTSSLAVGTCVPNFSWNWTSSFREITTSTTNEPTNKLTWSQYLLVVVIRLIDWWLIAKRPVDHTGGVVDGSEVYSGHAGQVRCVDVNSAVKDKFSDEFVATCDDSDV